MPSPSLLPGLEPAGDDAMWLDGRYRRPLELAGLDSFEAVMGARNGYCLRALRDRENWHLRVDDAHRQARGLYLKKHHVRTWTSRVRAWLGKGPGPTAGRTEAENVGALRAAGIEVMGLVAYGEKLRGNGLIESFVLTEELEGYTELRDFLRQRFSADHLHQTVSRDHDMDRLIGQVAQIARRFHQSGYNHRDLYCCHFFVKEPAPGQFEIRLIDLQRVQQRRWFRRRWIVKDLAQLAWSAPRDRIKCTQKLAFMRCYLGVPRLRDCDKRLIRAVLAKQRSMERRLGNEG